MRTITRRSVTALLASAPALPWLARAAGDEPARVVPFARGDVVVGCTLLDDPADDHRGRGRILHYGPDLQLRNTIWLDDTTHIVQGLRFGPDGTLWAFDAFAWKVARFARDGRRLANFPTPPRSFAHVTFAPDGTLYMGENFTGGKSKVPLRTTLPFMPGTSRFGDGHLFRFSARGKLLREFATPVHGGTGGFQGLTASVLADGGRRLIYTTESGPKIMQYDLAADRPLPDLVSHPDNSGTFYFDLAFDGKGRLLVVAGTKIEARGADGALLQTWPLPGFGWASMSEPRGSHLYVTNFFTGQLARLDLDSGKVGPIVEVGIRRSLSGVAEAA